MTIAVDATARLTGGTGGTDPLSWSHTNDAAADFIVVLTGTGDSSAGTREMDSATYNSVAMTRQEFIDDASWTSCSVFTLANPATGSNNVTISNISNTYNQRAATSISFTGATVGYVTSGTDTGTSANPSTTATGIQAGDIVVAICSNDNQSGTTTPGGTGIYTDENISSDLDVSTQYYVATGTSQVISWTQSGSGSNWTIAWVAVRGDSGGGGGDILMGQACL